LSEEQIAQLAQAAAGRNAIAATLYGIGYTLVLVLFTLLVALYYLVAGNVTNVRRSYSQWFALTCWTSLPTALNAIPAAVVLATASSNQIPQESLQPLSLNALFFHRAVGEPGYAILANVSVLYLLSIFLTILGIKFFSGRSWLYAFTFWLTPVVLLTALVWSVVRSAGGGT
jgi:hypothetical protein